MREARAAVGKCPRALASRPPLPRALPKVPPPQGGHGADRRETGSLLLLLGLPPWLYTPAPAYKEATGHPFKFLLPSWTFNPLSP